MTDTTVPYTYTTSPDSTTYTIPEGAAPMGPTLSPLKENPVQVKFFSCSYMKMDEMEEKINKFCKEHDVIKVDFLELAELVIVLVVYRE